MKTVRILLFLGLLVVIYPAFSQDTEDLADTTYVYGMKHFRIGEVATAATYFEKVVALRSQTDSSRLVNTFSNLGRCYADMGKKEQAWACYQAALRVSKKFNNEKGLAYLYNNMGILEEEQGNMDKSLEYFSTGLIYAEKIGNKGAEALCHESLGIAYGSNGNYPASKMHLMKALEIYEKAGESVMMVTLLGNLGSLAKEQNNYAEAADWFEKAKITARRNQNFSAIVESSASEAEMLLEQKENKAALQTLLESRPFLDSVQFLPVLSNYYEALTDAYLADNDWENAFEANDRYYVFRDSLFSNEQKQALSELRTKYEVAQKDLELSVNKSIIEKQRFIQWALLLGLLLVGVAAFIWWRAFRNKSRLNRLIKKEKQRSDELLLNILPGAVAEELKNNNRVEARRFEQVTVICTDFQDFTGIANVLSPEELVQLLDEYFQAFDTITTKFGVEKIKTMGDAYMCAGGLPDPSEGAPVAVMQAAIAMRDFVIDLRNKKMQQGLPFFNCRIGVHTGPVIAGIVGSKKFVYDIWGDTVNTATRMEQYGAIDKINVSEATHELLNGVEGMNFDYRGVLEVKGKGGTGMYFVQ